MPLWTWSSEQIHYFWELCKRIRLVKSPQVCTSYSLNTSTSVMLSNRRTSSSISMWMFACACLSINSVVTLASNVSKTDQLYSRNSIVLWQQASKDYSEERANLSWGALSLAWIPAQGEEGWKGEWRSKRNEEAFEEVFEEVFDMFLWEHLRSMMNWLS